MNQSKLQGLTDLTAESIWTEMERNLLPKLTTILKERADGHCMRISDLDIELMSRLCGRLRAEVPSATVVVLSNGHSQGVPSEFTVSSTKLVELRNPLADGSLRPPLLVFVPNNLRASAEDSFGVATFESIPLNNLYQDVIAQLLTELPDDIRIIAAELLRLLVEENWPFVQPLAQIRFLLTAKVNGADSESFGAALYELGLVPDFELFREPAKFAARIKRNRESVRKLTWSAKSERGRVFDLELLDKTFIKQLGDFLTEAGLEEPKSWTRRIAHERDAWRFAFNYWSFVDGGEDPDSICIYDVTTNLPTITIDNAEGYTNQLVGQQVLAVGTNGLRQFSVSFSVDPIPTRVQHLDKFILQIVSVERGPIGLVRSKKLWTTNKNSTTVSFSSLNKIRDWEEGWHFVRVLAQTADGDPISLIDLKGKPLPWTSDQEELNNRLNHSEPFYVLPDGSIEIEPNQRAIPRHESLMHAWMDIRFTVLAAGRDPSSVTVTDLARLNPKSKGAPTTNETIQAKFGREGKVNIIIVKHLNQFEKMILNDAAGPLSWNVLVADGGTVSSPTAGTTSWPQSVNLDSFIDARRRYFAALRGNQNDLVSQVADFYALRALISEYAGSYTAVIRELLQRSESVNSDNSQNALVDLQKLLALDSIHLSIRDFRNQQREAVLIAPTHPLRALWFTTWAEVGNRWLEDASGTSNQYGSATRDALLRYLSPLGFPSVLPIAGGKLVTTIDNIHPFWTLYGRADENDPRGLLGEVCASFGLPEPAVGGATIDGAYLATRVQRYLIQHPYVSTLVINAFNVGRAVALADMLRTLQTKSPFAELRYDIRIFVPDPDAPGIGEELATLLAEMDEFVSRTGNHLQPKLAISVRSITEFRNKPERHAAHLSFLIDLFPAQEISVAQGKEEGIAAVHGLIQSYLVDYHEDDTVVRWQRQPLHGLALPLSNAEELTQLLATLPALLSNAVSTVATGQSLPNLRPVITLTLEAEERALLHQVHEVCDWVFILDRNMGIEFFDHSQHVQRPDYLIDHSPDMTTALGHRLAITSRSLDEVQSLIQPALNQYGLQIENRHAVAILEQLRSLSGRLAFKLITASTQRSEAIGLALARMYLEHQGVFANQIVVPLDAHLDLYRSARQQAEDLGEEISLKRTDLALFDFNLAERMITCRLVEVKCHTNVGEFAAYQQLKQRIAEQITRSEDVLKLHFDPHRENEDRPDRLLKSYELATMLSFYLERSIRYGIMDPNAASEAHSFLKTLEDGYRLSFTRSGLIFDFAKSGTEYAEIDGGIEYYRIGQNLIKELIDAVAYIRSEASVAALEAKVEQSSYLLSELELNERRQRTPTIPTLEKAAFLSLSRKRSFSEEDSLDRMSDTMKKTVPSENNEHSKDVRQYDSSQQPPITPTSTTPSPINSTNESSRAEIKDIQRDTLEDKAPIVSTQRQSAPSDPSDKQFAIQPPRTDILLGVTSHSPQYGVLGEVAGRTVALDLNQTHTISLFGVQGGGKSYTLGTIAEMASLAIPQINSLPRPLATVIFHYSPTMDYKPEFTSMVAPNSNPEQIKVLAERYGALPLGLKDMLLLVPEDKLELRRAEYVGMEVRPLKFASAELKPAHWRFLMGAVGNQAMYLRQINRVMKSLRDELTIDGIRQGVMQAGLTDHLRDMALSRLNLAADYIDDSQRLSTLIRPGRLVIVDLRDEFIEKDEALGLFVVLLQLVSDAIYEDATFNKLVVFDEAHKYMESPDLIDGLIEVVREMRHKGTSIMVASQDPPSVPVALIELSSQIILHKFNSPAWLKHIQKANTALGDLTAEKMAQLKPGEAYIWSSKATDDTFTRGTVKIRCRPRVTQHGGETKTAIGG